MFFLQLAYELCPHHASHYLGMDVHDTNSVSRNIKMRAGMVITVEPGLFYSLTYTRVSLYKNYSDRTKIPI